jgi:hypothetical protein
MLPFQGVPVARRRRLLGLQIIERRPVVDDPGRLLQSNPSHAASLDFKAAMLTNQRKKVVPDRERTVVVGCYQFQAHVIVTAVHVPTAKRAADDGILGLFPRKWPSLFKPACILDISGGSPLVVLDVSAPGGEAVATVWLPARVPPGFHGNWIADGA